MKDETLSKHELKDQGQFIDVKLTKRRVQRPKREWNPSKDGFTSKTIGTPRDLDEVRKMLGLPKKRVFRGPKKSNKKNNAIVNLLPKGFLKQATPDMSIDLTNIDDLSYVAKIFVGSDKQGLDVVYDTGSDYLVIQANDCTDCLSDLFNQDTSTTYKVVDATEQTQTYGSAEVTGIIASDTTAFDDAWALKADDFNFFLAKSQYGIDDAFDGIFGMARNANAAQMADGFVNGPLLMHKLKEDGTIANNIFSFYLTLNPDQSSVQIGGIDTSKIMSGKSM